MKNIILMMCIVAYASIFSSCSTDDSPTASANLMQTQNSTARSIAVKPEEGTIATGTITGSFYPLIPSTVVAIRGNSKELKYTGYVWGAGFFKIAPVPIGTYTVSIIPKGASGPFVSIREVEVRAGQTTDVGAISLYVEENN